MQWFYLLVTLLLIVNTAVLIEGGECSSCDCGPNSSFSLCGTQCESLCGHEAGSLRFCPLKGCAKPGCYCNKGYARNADGICVKQKDCCDAKTEVRKFCGNVCEKTCENRNQRNPVCTALCVFGCFCREGLVRRDDGTCVDASECPRTECNPALDEVYKKCGTACPKTCEQPLERSCTKDCVKGCFCKDGYLRRKDGKCVEEEDACKFICPRNQIYKSCGLSCPKTCKSLVDKNRSVCTDLCVDGCACVAHFVLNEHGVCVPPEWCGKCGPNEIYYPASPLPCPPETCSDFCYNDPPYGRTAAGCPARCGCKPGFVLSDDDDNCCVYAE